MKETFEILYYEIMCVWILICYLQTTVSFYYNCTCLGDGPVACPDGMVSDTGYYPGCTCRFINPLYNILIFVIKKAEK